MGREEKITYRCLAYGHEKCNEPVARAPIWIANPAQKERCIILRGGDKE